MAPNTKSRAVFPGEFEQMLLLTILRLGADAYAIDIRRFLQQRAGRSVSRGALYRTLDRLHEKGYVRWSLEEGDDVRDGHHRRLFTVTDNGVGVLGNSRATLMTLWEGLEPMLEQTQQ
jgi:DNA-binding PadR family transcriptional regulator